MTEQAPTTVPAGKLSHGECVTRDNGDVFRVEHVHHYRDGNGRRSVALMLAPIGPGEPVHWKKFADSPIQIATAEQATDAFDEANRWDLVRRLRAVADLIAEHGLRFDVSPRFNVTAGLVDGEIGRVAALLGVDLVDMGGKKHATTYLESGMGGTDVSLMFYGKPDAPEVVPAEPGSDAEQIVAAVLAPDEPYDLWFFVFGPNSEHHGRYLALYGSEESTRIRVERVFGEGAADQYSREDARVDHLMVMPEVEWPTTTRAGE